MAYNYEQINCMCDLQGMLKVESENSTFQFPLKGTQMYKFAFRMSIQQSWRYFTKHKKGLLDKAIGISILWAGMSGILEQTLFKEDSKILVKDYYDLTSEQSRGKATRQNIDSECGVALT